MAKGTARGQGQLFELNLLYFGDNLPILREYIRDESIDLVYLDPPFKSNQDYNILFKEHGKAGPAAQIKAFRDTWRWDQAAWNSYQETVRTGPSRVSEALQAFRKLVGNSDMLAYLSMMAPRLVELHRVLRVTGTLYLHCDSAASHYLKVLLDSIFGPDRFVNEIVWRRHNARRAERRWPRIHDVLLMYAKGPDYKFHPAQVRADRAKLPHTLIRGPDGKLYQTYELTGAGVTKEGESGRPWRGFDPTKFGRHWAHSHATMDEWDSAGLIHWPKPGAAGGFPRRRAAKPFHEDARTVTVGDVWTDIDRINQAAKERLGYPTQKPQALLERILRASSDEGDLVLDPFCGCGTTVAAAQALNRRWIGIDIAKIAIEIIQQRLDSTYGPEIRRTYEVRAEPASLEDAYSLAEEDKHAFQDWALRRIGAQPGTHKKGADKGIDGRMYYVDPLDGEAKLIVVSVKGGSTGPSHVRDLRGVMERENAAIGVLLSRRPPTQAMKAEAAEAGSFYAENVGRMIQRLQIVTLADLFAGKGVEFPAEALVPTVPSVTEAAGEAKRNLRVGGKKPP